VVFLSHDVATGQFDSDSDLVVFQDPINLTGKNALFGINED
jgi:hypothetical protein